MWLRESNVIVVFFFKQKTAYEVRISDWSSDVCSSDLDDRRNVALRGGRSGVGRAGGAAWPAAGRGRRIHAPRLRQWEARSHRRRGAGRPHPGRHRSAARSEEHTSELQSLMRSSYAVFCLKKKKEHTTMNKTTQRKHVD